MFNHKQSITFSYFIELNANENSVAKEVSTEATFAPTKFNH